MLSTTQTLRSGFLSLVLIFLAYSAAAFASTTADVSTELKALADQSGFQIKGVENTEGEKGRLAGDEPFERLRNLLAHFAYVVVRNPEGGIERVIVLGKKTPQPERNLQIVLDTKRQGSQHLLQVTLRGPGPAPVVTWVLLDTGADQVVLPASLADTLGFTADALTDTQVQTANGQIKARLGQLASIELGVANEGNISVAFIEDERLGSPGLLGMNVLSRYKVTIDDDANQVRLEPKR